MTNFATFSQSEGLFLSESKELIGNFDVKVIARVEKSVDGQTEDYVRLKFVCQGGYESGTHEVPLPDLEKTDWFKVNSKCLTDPRCTKAKAYIAYIIKSALSDCKTENQYVLSKSGHYTIDGVPVVLLGDKVFSSASQELKTTVEIAPMSRLIIDADKYPERKAAMEVMNIASLCSCGMAILSFLLFNLIRPVYYDVNIIHNPVLFVRGPSGIKKTSFVTYLTQILDNDRGIAEPAQLISTTVSAVTELFSRGMGVFILDDKFPSNIRSLESKQEKLLTEVVRIAADGSPRTKMSGKKVLAEPQKLGLMLTGEHDIISNLSTMARILTLDFNAPINRGSLHSYQQHPYIIPTFVYYFLQWFVDNYESVKGFLSDNLSKLRNGEGLGIHGKLENSYFCLVTAFGVLMQYFIEKGFMPPESAKSLYDSYSRYVLEMVKAQDRRVQQSCKKNSDFIKIIGDLYRKGNFDLGKSAKNVIDKDYDGFVEDDFLYLRSEKLLSKVREIDPYANFKRIKTALDSRGALKHHNGDKTVNVGGSRFYAIYLKKL